MLVVLERVAVPRRLGRMHVRAGWRPESDRGRLTVVGVHVDTDRLLRHA